MKIAKCSLLREDDGTFILFHKNLVVIIFSLPFLPFLTPSIRETQLHTCLTEAD